MFKDKAIVDYLVNRTNDEQLIAAGTIYSNYEDVVNKIVHDWAERLKINLTDKLRGIISTKKILDYDWNHEMHLLTIYYDSLNLQVLIYVTPRDISSKVKKDHLIYGVCVILEKYNNNDKLAEQDHAIQKYMKHFKCDRIKAGIISAVVGENIKDPNLLVKMRVQNKNTYLFEKLLNLCKEVENL